MDTDNSPNKSTKIAQTPDLASTLRAGLSLAAVVGLARFRQQREEASKQRIVTRDVEALSRSQENPLSPVSPALASRPSPGHRPSLQNPYTYTRGDGGIHILFGQHSRK